MSNLVKAIEDLYKTMLLARHFPEAFSLKDKIFSIRALKQHFAEKKFLKEKKTQILCVTHALGSVAVSRNIPNPSESETQKVVESIKRAMEMDPDFFKNESADELVRDAITFLQKHDSGKTKSNGVRP